MKIYKTLRDIQPEHLRVKVIHTHGPLVEGLAVDLLNDLGGYICVPEDQEEVDLLCKNNTWDTYRYHKDVRYHELWSATNNGGGHTFYVEDRFNVNLTQQFNEHGDFIA